MEDKRWDELKDHLNKLKERLENEIEKNKDALHELAQRRFTTGCEVYIKRINSRMDELNNIHYVLGKMTEINSTYGVITNE